MRKDRLFWMLMVSAVIFSFALSGCGSSRPAKVYILSAAQPPATAAKGVIPSAPPATVGVGPIQIPDYLDRPQIVTRTAQHELVVAQFDRWGGSLRHDITRVLLENLSALLPSDRASVVPWIRGGVLQYRVAVEVIRFDVTPGENVWLRAQWTIFGQDGAVLLFQESNLKEPLSGRDYPSMVAAMSQALGSLSKEIANRLTSALSGK